MKYGVIIGEIHLLLIKSQYQRMLFVRKISTLAIKHDFPNRRVEMWCKRLPYLKSHAIVGDAENSLVYRKWDCETSYPESNEIATFPFLRVIIGLLPHLSKFGTLWSNCYIRFIKDKIFPAIFLLPRSLKWRPFFPKSDALMLELSKNG